MQLLLVEDDPAFGGALRDGLALDGHEVDWLRAAAGMAGMLGAARYDAVILDLGLPDGDGHALLQAMRARGDATPVVVLSGRGQIADRVSLLDAGADDYLVKPVDLSELTARVRAVRRRGGAAPEVLRHGALELDRQRRRATLRGREIVLRDREFSLLEIFLREPMRLFTRAQLEALLYGAETVAVSNAVEVHLHFLRRKFGRDVVVTVRGEGYRLGPEPAAD
jgi:DNA-binding response OmpR family regulator